MYGPGYDIIHAKAVEVRVKTVCVCVCFVLAQPQRVKRKEKNRPYRGTTQFLQAGEEEEEEARELTLDDNYRHPLPIYCAREPSLSSAPRF